MTMVMRRTVSGRGWTKGCVVTISAELEKVAMAIALSMGSLRFYTIKQIASNAH
jgi:hypothetical protein